VHAFVGIQGRGPRTFGGDRKGSRRRGRSSRASGFPFGPPRSSPPLPDVLTLSSKLIV
jgi:hypothetical protein